MDGTLQLEAIIIDVPATLVTKTTRPRVSLRSGRNVCVTRTGPTVLTSRICLRDSIGHHSISDNAAIPALLMTAQNSVNPPNFA
jgi:hypothetical protein